jgi:hypothetical protein
MLKDGLWQLTGDFRSFSEEREKVGRNRTPEDAGGFREETHSVLRVLFVINA